MNHGLYEVAGTRRYRGHEPGTRFACRLEPGPERRAIARGDLRLIERIVPDIPPGSHRLPPGWADSTQTTEAPDGASSIGGSE